MTHDFDQAYWDAHWKGSAGADLPVNPHLVAETRDLTAGTALDAGCGAGTEAAWLAQQGWRVVGADISEEALAAARALPVDVEWVVADLTTWEPGRLFDLVTTHYAHPAIPQLEFYDRLAGWVAPGGTLLVVAHAPDGHHPPEASADAGAITARLDPEHWRIDTSTQVARQAGAHGRLADVVVRATRQS